MLHPSLSPYTTLSFVLSSPASYNNRVLCAKFNLPETTKQKKAGRNGGRKEVIREFRGVYGVAERCRRLQRGLG